MVTHPNVNRPIREKKAASYTAGRFRKFGIHPLGVPATQGSHDQFWRPRDRTEVSVIVATLTYLQHHSGKVAGSLPAPSAALSGHCDLLGELFAKQANDLLGKELAKKVNDLLSECRPACFELGKQSNDKPFAEQANDLLMKSRPACPELGKQANDLLGEIFAEQANDLLSEICTTEQPNGLLAKIVRN
ncbi:hypothetical protein PCASD_19772 [Puccinia coronata f. sp. avenae]|uniref:Uncharacterized protein n=1 Tax=Puccinia coronata f. sp. avenae TaxID=200324 RepID=A0A2N5SLW0_9BASI|nr:hypothetical protein PCASD_19772 [Puccinia coronata f. sp. avenae]